MHILSVYLNPEHLERRNLNNQTPIQCGLINACQDNALLYFHKIVFSP